jgi:uncharacterized RDD family membrane protein YckC
MNHHFYIAVNGQQTGPFIYEQLKGMNLKYDTMVWHEGLENWTRADQVPILMDIFNSHPSSPGPAINQKINHQGASNQPPMISSKYFGYTLARSQDRFFAYLVQNLIVLIPFFLIYGEEIFNSDEEYTLVSFVDDAIYSAISGAILGAICYPIWGRSLGHKVLGLKVISAVDGSDYSQISQGVVREAIKGALSAFFVPAMWLLWDDDKQNLYDKITKTFVVKDQKIG